jgi:BirA family biotin operon repressor/biotin-[acetyl-CoA-carboxylase] ligase
LLWSFDLPAAALAGLSLAAGVAVADALGKLGLDETTLKWPNDVLWRGRKLGGILVEIAGESEGPTRAVVGVGVNYRMPVGAGQLIEAEQWLGHDRRSLRGCADNADSGRARQRLSGAR